MDAHRLVQDLKKGSEETSQEGTKRIPKKRWIIAQDSEIEYWDDYSQDTLLKESADRYPKKCKILLKEWAKYIAINDDIKILQVGCGPEDVIHHFKVGDSHGIDPLADFYKKKFNMPFYKTITSMQKARGEEIPFPNQHFDVVTIINVLDHTEIPDQVISEMHRVCKDNGIIHFENYIYQKRFIQMAKLIGYLRQRLTKYYFNIHHPYMFTMQDTRRLVRRKFNILFEEVGRDIGLYDSFDELKELVEKHETKISRRILTKLGYLGIINHTLIGRKIQF
jgi:ubiquinone/menaquinone biosynthesis C-methylase UbiE